MVAIIIHIGAKWTIYLYESSDISIVKLKS